MFQYEKTVESVFSATDSLETLLELMQVYREKGFIFNKTCMLVGLLAHDPSRRKVLLLQKYIFTDANVYDLGVADTIFNIYLCMLC